MKNSMNNEKGLTLVEVLAVIVIGTLLLILISNTHLFGQKQYKIQSEKAAGLYDVTYALKVITKEIRKSENRTVVSEGSITLDGDRYTFDSINHSINKNDIPFASDIGHFSVIELTSGKWELVIVSLSGKEIHTVIILR